MSNADPLHLLALLRERRRRPGSHRAAEKRNKFATSKARVLIYPPCKESLNQRYHGAEGAVFALSAIGPSTSNVQVGSRAAVAIVREKKKLRAST